MSEQPYANSGDVREVQALVAWAREQGIDLSVVQCGSVRLEIRQSTAQSGAVPTPHDGRPTLYEKFGGQVFRDVATELGLGAMVPAIEAKQR